MHDAHPSNISIDSSLGFQLDQTTENEMIGGLV